MKSPRVIWLWACMLVAMASELAKAADFPWVVGPNQTAATPSAISSIAFYRRPNDPGPSGVVTGDYLGHLAFWSLESLSASNPTPLDDVPSDPLAVLSVAAAQNGIVASGMSSRTRFWIPPGGYLGTLPGSPAGLQRIFSNGTGSRIAGFHQQEIVLWSVGQTVTLEPAPTLPDDAPSDIVAMGWTASTAPPMSASSTASGLLAIDRRQRVLQWTEAGSTELQLLPSDPASESNLKAVAALDVPPSVWTGDRRGLISYWQPTVETQGSTIGPVAASAFSDDGGKLITLSQDRKTLTFIQTDGTAASTSQDVDPPANVSQVRLFAFEFTKPAPPGETPQAAAMIVWTVAPDSVIDFYDTDGRVVRTSIEGTVTSIALRQDGLFVAASGSKGAIGLHPPAVGNPAGWTKTDIETSDPNSHLAMRFGPASALSQLLIAGPNKIDLIDTADPMAPASLGSGPLTDTVISHADIIWQDGQLPTLGIVASQPRELSVWRQTGAPMAMELPFTKLTAAPLGMTSPGGVHIQSVTNGDYDLVTQDQEHVDCWRYVSLGATAGQLIGERFSKPSKAFPRLVRTNTPALITFNDKIISQPVRLQTVVYHGPGGVQKLFPSLLTGATGMPPTSLLIAHLSDKVMELAADLTAVPIADSLSADAVVAVHPTEPVVLVATESANNQLSLQRYRRSGTNWSAVGSSVPLPKRLLAIEWGRASDSFITSDDAGGIQRWSIKNDQLVAEPLSFEPVTTPMPQVSPNSLVIVNLPSETKGMRVLAAAEDRLVGVWSDHATRLFKAGAPFEWSTRNRESPHYAVAADQRNQVVVTSAGGSVALIDLQREPSVDARLFSTTEANFTAPPAVPDSAPLIYSSAWFNAMQPARASTAGLGSAIRQYESTGPLELQLAKPRPVYALARHPAQDVIAVGTAAVTDAKTLEVWRDPFSNNRQILWSGGTERILAAAFSTDGEILGTIDSQGQVILWDTKALAASPSSAPSMQVVAGLSGRTTSLAWSRRQAGGHQLVLGNTNRSMTSIEITPRP